MAHTIFLVDDHHDTRMALEALLTFRGYRVETSATAIEALSRLRRCESDLPEAILFDLSMPEMDGVAFCAELVRDARLRDIPRLILSGHAEAEGMARLLGARFFEKPTDLEALFSALAALPDQNLGS
jgi:CheY-like chemotaxis protein